MEGSDIGVNTGKLTSLGIATVVKLLIRERVTEGATGTLGSDKSFGKLYPTILSSKTLQDAKYKGILYNSLGKFAIADVPESQLDTAPYCTIDAFNLDAESGDGITYNDPFDT